MNNEIFKLLGTIGIDTSAADKEIDNTVKNADKEVSKIPDFFKKAAKMIGTVFAVSKIIDFTKTSVEAAAAAEAMSSQFGQVFGDAVTSAQTNLDAIAKETGMLPNRLKGSFTQIAAFAKTTGMETANALTLADRATRAAADGAAFYDKSVESMTESLQSFLKGNFENDAALGISATETTRNAKANELYGKSFIKLSEDQKQLTLLAMVEDGNKLSGALGQASREADTYGNQVGNLKQAWQDFKVLIGAPMMDTVVAGLKTLSEWVTTAGEKLGELKTWMDENKWAVDLLVAGLSALTAAFTAQSIINVVREAMKKYKEITDGQTISTWALNAAMNANPFGLVAIAIGALIGIGVLLWKNWDTVKEKASQLFSAVKTKFTQIGDAIKGPLETAMNFVKGVIDKIKGFFKFEWSLPKLKMPHVKINGEFSLLPPKVPKFSIDWYKDGGIMTRPTMFGLNGMNPMVGGEAGHEAILPLNRETLGQIGDRIMSASGLGVSNRFDEAVDLLVEGVELLSQIVGLSDKQLILDTGVLAGQLTPKINKELGKEADRKRRNGGG